METSGPGERQAAAASKGRFVRLTSCLGALALVAFLVHSVGYFPSSSDRKPKVVKHSAGGGGRLSLATSSGESAGKNNSLGKMDIVLTHYSRETLEETATWWEGFLDIDMVRELQPAVYVYCQNPNITDLSRLTPLLRYGGRLQHLDNLGRESHAFLTHIIKYYGQLPEHVLFSQDIPVDTKLWHRFQKMFVPETGFLPLAIVGHQDCEDGWLPRGLMPQLYAMFTHQICPPQGFTAAFNGQFLVSRRRLRNVGLWTYTHLLELVSAPSSHWIHNAHNDSHYKAPDNPMFGHVVERAWSLAFTCYDSWREDNCYGCDHDRGMEGCGTDCCQCMDLET